MKFVLITWFVSKSAISVTSAQFETVDLERHSPLSKPSSVVRQSRSEASATKRQRSRKAGPLIAHLETMGVCHVESQNPPSRERSKRPRTRLR